MSLDIVSELWNMVTDCLSDGEASDISKQLVAIILENDFSPDDIISSFGSDKHIRSALSMYIEEDQLELFDVDDDNWSIDEDE
jgi:superfamily I DNA and RNA helicase